MRKRRILFVIDETVKFESIDITFSSIFFGIEMMYNDKTSLAPDIAKCGQRIVLSVVTSNHKSFERRRSDDSFEVPSFSCVYNGSRYTLAFKFYPSSTSYRQHRQHSA